VVSGTISAPAALPAGAEIVVRIIDILPPDEFSRANLPLGDRGALPPIERVLGEHRQTLPGMATDPVPFRIEFSAEDSRLRQGLNLDVRITHDGRVRYRTISAHLLTPASAPYPQHVTVQPLE
jgi:uncharacterized lipoprotein YbaY